MRERSPRVWELIVEAGRDPVTGKRRQASRTFRGILRPRGHPGRHGGRLVAAGPGDRDRAGAAARDADRRARALGMKAYFGRTAAQLAELGGRGGPAHLSRREEEVPALVAEGLTNRQIAERLVISSARPRNHVQPILTKLGFATRSQIAAWSAQGRR